MGLVYILPVVTRFRCPPDMPLSISSPTIVSAHNSSPSIYIEVNCVVRSREVIWTQMFSYLHGSCISQGWFS